MLTALLLLLAATGCDNFDNDKLTEERAMHVFGTKGAPKEPPEDTYSPPEDTSPADTVTQDLSIQDESDGSVADVCMPDCVDKECGPDGCGGNCGACTGLEGGVDDTLCNGGICCKPNCTGKVCGDDGCGGSCGTCSGQLNCHDGVCKPGECIPDCGGKECGADGCASTCGTCGTGTSCQAGKCEVKCGDGQCGAGEDKCNCPADCTGGCAGCCSGTVCKAGTLNSECGKNGASCTNCSSSGKVCQSQACVTAAPTWKDLTSGLTWQVTPTGGTMNWSDAKAHCSGLSLDGGGWHLPTISELRSLIRGCPGTVTDGACEVTDSCLSYSSCWDEGACWSCSGGAGPADGGMYWPDEVEGDCCWYWSSSPVEDYDGHAWNVNFYNGDVIHNDVYNDLHARCVR